MRGRRIFAIAFAVACATAVGCGIFLDPDKLVADRSDEAGSTPPNEAGPPSDDGGAADADDPDANLTGQVPACAPPPPALATAFAIVSGSPSVPPACPTGYLATPALTAYTSFSAPGTTCTATGCTCGAVQTGATCAFRLHYYADNNCIAGTGLPVTLSPALCTRPNPAGAVQAGKVLGDFSPGVSSCPPGGAATNTSADAGFNAEVVACKPDPAVVAKLAPCDGGEIAMPPVTGPILCYQALGPSCAAGYTTKHNLNSTTGYTDNRSCSCKCNVDAGGAGCNDASADEWNADINCNGTADQVLAPGVCKKEIDLPKSMRAQNAPAVVGISCATGATGSGTATAPAADIILCCAQ